MILSTTSTLEGHRIKSYAGIVTGEAIIGANIFSDFFARVRDVVGGRAGSYENKLAEARAIAMREMQEEAARLGANAVVGIDLDYQVLGDKNGMLMVTVCGTAVVLDPAR
jgi:uncharacterized protein YbjQ (UPF0145 family)